MTRKGVRMKHTKTKQRRSRVQGPVVREATGREREVAQAIVDGLSNQDIGERLGLSTKTVEAHRANLYRKLCVRNCAQFIQVALNSGLVKMGGLHVA